MVREIDLFEFVAISARAMPENVFTEPDDDWTPVAFMEGKKGKSIFPLAPYMGTDMEKDMLANVILPMAIDEMQVTTIVMVLSTWTSKSSTQAINEGGEYLRPSQQPDREERLMLVEYTREGVQRHAFAEIIRHESEPPTLGEWDEMPANSFEGRFVGPVVKAMRAVRA